MKFEEIIAEVRKDRRYDYEVKLPHWVGGKTLIYDGSRDGFYFVNSPGTDYLLLDEIVSYNWTLKKPPITQLKFKAYAGPREEDPTEGVTFYDCDAVDIPTEGKWEITVRRINEK